MNRTRWVILALAVAMAGLLLWFSRNTVFETVKVATPPRGEARTNPFYGVMKLADALGARTSWGPTLETPLSDAVVVVSAFHWSLLPSRRDSLQHWVESGGRLVADNQLLGTAAFAGWSGITRAFPPAVEDDDADDAADRTADDGTERCRALRGSDQRDFTICQYPDRSWLKSTRQPIWSLSDDTGIQAVRVALGRGTVTVINASPFATGRLFEGDHARLFVALTQLRRGDEVRFLSENERPSLLALVWRHGAPVLILGSLWLTLALWRGAGRFGPLAADGVTARRSLAEQIRGTGHFTLRAGSGDTLHTATMRALIEAAQKRITGFRQLAPAARAAAVARITTLDAPALLAAMTLTDFRRMNELRSTLALLETARRQLLTRSTEPPDGTH